MKKAIFIAAALLFSQSANALECVTNIKLLASGTSVLFERTRVERPIDCYVKRNGDLKRACERLIDRGLQSPRALNGEYAVKNDEGQFFEHGNRIGQCKP